MLLFAADDGNALLHAAFHMAGPDVHDSHLIDAGTVGPGRGGRFGALHRLLIFREPFVVELLHGDGRLQVVGVLVIFHQGGIGIVIGGEVGLRFEGFADGFSLRCLPHRHHRPKRVS